MRLDRGIKKLGFRKWYERELLQSHAHMVLAFLSFVGAFGAFELLSTPGTNKTLNALVILVCALIGAWAIRRYVRLLTQAEAVANQAQCPQCATYARFKLVDERLALQPQQAARVHVHCKQCDTEWPIEPF